jgi:hypothetical protein
MTGCGFLHPRSVLLVHEPLVIEASRIEYWGSRLFGDVVGAVHAQGCGALAAVGLLGSMRKPSLVGATNLGKGPATSADAGGHGARDQEYGEHG